MQGKLLRLCWQIHYGPFLYFTYRLTHDVLQHYNVFTHKVHVDARRVGTESGSRVEDEEPYPYSLLLPYFPYSFPMSLVLQFIRGNIITVSQPDSRRLTASRILGVPNTPNIGTTACFSILCFSCPWIWQWVRLRAFLYCPCSHTTFHFTW